MTSHFDERTIIFLVVVFVCCVAFWGGWGVGVDEWVVVVVVVPSMVDKEYIQTASPR